MPFILFLQNKVWFIILIYIIMITDSEHGEHVLVVELNVFNNKTC